MEEMSDEDSFLTLSRSSEAILKDRGSKFLGYAFPVKSEDEIKTHLQELKKKYYDATHHCYAWIQGRNGEQFRANDDGEPNHSAGDPILGQIKSFNLTNTLVVVVRYYGGTKLGVSGLIQAYKTSAAMALEANEIIREFVQSEIEIEFPYPSMNEVMKLVKKLDLEIITQTMELNCRFTLQFREGLKEEVVTRLEEIENLVFLTD
ncbi:IMPACT family protein [Algoriphagus mannitolivorans]|uniref:IMPACT family protein n=1 Tax=Algoriphagus mannitolivorans TaxID=226504 RepID=UPI0003FF85ED|nr:YigZ family protein [Algoriphagus mannitolivorans]